MDKALVKAFFAHDFLLLYAVLLWIHFKIKVMQNSDRLPKIGLIAVAEFICKPAHNIADYLSVLKVKLTFIVFFQKFKCLLLCHNISSFMRKT